MQSVSERGARAAVAAVRPDQDIYFEASGNRYDSETNPDGVFLMNIAENKLGWSILRAEMERATRAGTIPDWTAGYTDPAGHPDVRKAVAGFMSRHIVEAPVDPDNLSLSAGASGVLDLVSFVLGDPGDAVAYPAPCYPAYTHDMGAKADLVRHDIITHHEPADLRSGPLLTVDDLDEAKATLADAGRRLCMVVVTSPDNPTGGVYGRADLDRYADWCIAHGVHLVVNEIYGLSLIDTDHASISDDYVDPAPFSSFGQIVIERNNDFLHHVYAFSKDFGISGFRLGVLHTTNVGLRTAVMTLNTAHLTSNHTQWLLQQVLENDEFVDRYVDEYPRLLTESYVAVVTSLRNSGIPYTPSRGSVFVWADFSELLAAPTLEAENDLWSAIFESSGLLLTPGEGFGHTKRGQFRIVYAGLNSQELSVALARLARFVDDFR